MKTLLRFWCVLLIGTFGIGAAMADGPITREFPPGMSIPAAAMPGPAFDADKATDAWLGLLTPEQRALSDAYFEGGYWLELWSLLYGLGMMAILLVTGFSRRMREFAERITSRRFAGVALYAAGFIVAFAVLELPFSIYVEFLREHAYGLSNLTFGGWMRERLIGLMVSLVLGTIVLTLLFAGIRRAGARWWVWATGFSFVFTLLIDMIYPVFIAPLFNDYKPLAEGPVRDAIMAMARANEVPTTRVEWFDASRQTSRVSANVSGVAGIARINLNDNLLNRTSLPEIKAVLGHEMGHYVLNHSFKLTVYFTLVYGIAFAAVAFALDRALARFGGRLGLRDRADPAALPLVIGIFSVVWFALMPLSRNIVRSVEAEADAFGLNAAREPQGFAMASMRLSTYRKMKPGPIEEFIFYDHPSGYDRVRRAMLWQKENLPAP